AAFPINEGQLQPEIRSPYHGDFILTPDLTISPDGKYLLNGYGHMFSSETMRHMGKLDRHFSSIAIDTNYGELYTANSSNLITAYNYPTLESFAQMTSYGNIEKMFYDSNSDELIALTKVNFGKSNYSLTGIEKIYFDTE
ncbi:MAG TPA: hypothetical protein VK947_09940, partial [Planococcus sp. (in: firmicutes)]|nr:hypothetical protein [Planococcus sp. (in: firmicutes)]